MGHPSRKVNEIDLAKAWIIWLVDTRRGYLEALLRLSAKERLRDRGASYPSMQDIFLHILDNNSWGRAIWVRIWNSGFTRPTCC